MYETICETLAIENYLKVLIIVTQNDKNFCLLKISLTFFFHQNLVTVNFPQHIRNWKLHKNNDYVNSHMPGVERKMLVPIFGSNIFCQKYSKNKFYTNKLA